MTRRAVALFLLSFVLLAFTGTGLGNAAPPESRPRTITSLTVVEDDSEVASTVLSLGFAEPINQRELREAVAAVGGDPTSVVIDGPAATASGNSTGEVGAMAGPSGQGLPCGSGNTWYDSNGKFNLQHQCGWTTVPWSWTMNSNLHPTVVGTVYERGMDWWKNGVKQPRQAPHTDAWPNYIFHGTFSGSPTGTRIAYEDVITWRHNVAGGGTATLRLAGNFYYYYW